MSSTQEKEEVKVITTTEARAMEEPSEGELAALAEAEKEADTKSSPIKPASPVKDTRPPKMTQRKLGDLFGSKPSKPEASAQEDEKRKPPKKEEPAEEPKKVQKDEKRKPAKKEEEEPAEEPKKAQKDEKRKPTKKEEEPAEEQDAEKELKKAQKEKIKALIREKRAKEKKAKRASSFIDDAAEKDKDQSEDEAEDTDTEAAQMTEKDAAFIKPDDESDSESADSEASDTEDTKNKKKHKKRKRVEDDDEAEVVTEAEAQEEELANHMEEALAGVGSRASQNGKKDDSGEKKKGGKKAKICGYCDNVIEKGWIPLRGEITGTGNNYVYFHVECTAPFMKESEKRRASGQKPSTAKGGKKESKKVRVFLCVCDVHHLATGRWKEEGQESQRATSKESQGGHGHQQGPGGVRRLPRPSRPVHRLPDGQSPPGPHGGRAGLGAGRVRHQVEENGQGTRSPQTEERQGPPGLALLPGVPGRPAVVLPHDQRTRLQGVQEDHQGHEGQG